MGAGEEGERVKGDCNFEGERGEGKSSEGVEKTRELRRGADSWRTCYCKTLNNTII